MIAKAAGPEGTPPKRSFTLGHDSRSWSGRRRRNGRHTHGYQGKGTWWKVATKFRQNPRRDRQGGGRSRSGTKGERAKSTSGKLPGVERADARDVIGKAAAGPSSGKGKRRPVQESYLKCSSRPWAAGPEGVRTLQESYLKCSAQGREGRKAAKERQAEQARRNQPQSKGGKLPPLEKAKTGPPGGVGPEGVRPVPVSYRNARPNPRCERQGGSGAGRLSLVVTYHQCSRAARGRGAGRQAIWRADKTAGEPVLAASGFSCGWGLVGRGSSSSATKAFLMP